MHVRISSRLRSERGEVVSVTGVLTDITERKKGERQLRESEQRFREILENISLAAVIVDVQGVLLFCNDYFLRVVERRRTPLLGKKFADECIPLTERPLFQLRVLDRMREDMIPGHVEIPLLTVSGRVLPFTWNTTAVRDLEGNVVGVTCIGQEIAEQPRASQ